MPNTNTLFATFWYLEPSMLQVISMILGARTLHIACYLQHVGVEIFHSACYLQRVGAEIFHSACYLQHFGAASFHFARYLQHLGAGAFDFVCYLQHCGAGIFQIAWCLQAIVGCWFWLLVLVVGRCVVVVPVVPAVPVAFAVAFVVAGAVVVATVSVVVAVLVADVVSRAAAVVFAVVVAVVRAWRLQHLGGTNLHVMSNEYLPHFGYYICSILELQPSVFTWYMQYCGILAFPPCMVYAELRGFNLSILHETLWSFDLPFKDIFEAL